MKREQKGEKYTNSNNIIVVLYKDQWKNKNKINRIMSCRECDLSPTG